MVKSIIELNRRNVPVNTRARQIIEKARKELGYTYEEIGSICKVSTVTVQRWYAIGRAKPSAIAPIEKLVRDSRLPVQMVAETLVDIYRDDAVNRNDNGKKKSFRLSHRQLLDIAGRHRLLVGFLEELKSELEEQGFIILHEKDRKERDWYVVLRKGWALRNATFMDDEKLNRFYSRIAEEDLEEELTWDEEEAEEEE